MTKLPLRFSRRFVLLFVLGIALCVILFLLVRANLIQQMRLPRLVINTGTVVTSVAITPDGKTVFSGFVPVNPKTEMLVVGPADVLVWDAASGRLVRRLSGCNWRSDGVSVSPDERHVIALGGEDASYWDWTNGQKLWTVAGETPLCFSPNGKKISIANNIYDAATGAKRLSISMDVDESGQIEFTPDGSEWAAIGDADAKQGHFSNWTGYYAPTRLRFWHTDTGKPALDLPFTRVRAFDISADGTWLVMTSDSQTPLYPGEVTNVIDGSVVRRINLRTGAIVWTRERSENGKSPDADAMLNSVAISPSGKYVVVESGDCRLIVLNASTGHEIFRTLKTQGQWGQSWEMPGGLAFSQDGRTLVSRCGFQVLVWNATSLN